MFKIVLNMATSNGFFIEGLFLKVLFLQNLKNITTLQFFRALNVFMKCLGDFWNSNILGYIFLNIKMKLPGFPKQKKCKMKQTLPYYVCL